MLIYSPMTKKNQKRQSTVAFIALGCPKNIVDSEKMLANIGQAGFILTPDIDNADIVVINTCGFITPAKDEAMGFINEAINAKKAGTVRKVIVAGCLSQRMGDELLTEAKGIDAIIGLDRRDDISSIIKDTLKKSHTPKAYLDSSQKHAPNDSGRLLITPPHWAYLRISEGCDRTCAFCTIPAIRGKFISKPQETIYSEARELVANGAVELNLVAQDSSYYGKDLGLKDGLVQLLKELCKIDELKWIRLMYLYPSGVTDELIQTIAENEKIVNYVDMPIQHINNDILKSMRRSETKEDIIALLERLRTAMPDITLRTTVIAGLPGETKQHFDELLVFLKLAKFDALGCFPFYPEPGTLAAELPDQVDKEIRDKRVDKLMTIQQQIAFEKAESKIGTNLTCLIDDIEEDGTRVARSKGQAPHIDSICLIRNSTKNIGQFTKAKVIGTDGYDLILKEE